MTVQIGIHYTGNDVVPAIVGSVMEEAKLQMKMQFALQMDSADMARKTDPVDIYIAGIVRERTTCRKVIEFVLFNRPRHFILYMSADMQIQHDAIMAGFEDAGTLWTISSFKHSGSHTGVPDVMQHLGSAWILMGTHNDNSRPRVPAIKRLPKLPVPSLRQFLISNKMPVTLNSIERDALYNVAKHWLDVHSVDIFNSDVFVDMYELCSDAVPIANMTSPTVDDTSDGDDVSDIDASDDDVQSDCDSGADAESASDSCDSFDDGGCSSKGSSRKPTLPRTKQASKQAPCSEQEVATYERAVTSTFPIITNANSTRIYLPFARRFLTMTDMHTTLGLQQIVNPVNFDMGLLAHTFAYPPLHRALRHLACHIHVGDNKLPLKRNSASMRNILSEKRPRMLTPPPTYQEAIAAATPMHNSTQLTHANLSTLSKSTSSTLEFAKPMPMARLKRTGTPDDDESAGSHNSGRSVHSLNTPAWQYIRQMRAPTTDAVSVSTYKPVSKVTGWF